MVENGIRLQDRYRGVLLGLACGDALGGPVEFKSRDEVAELHPGGLRDFVGGGWLTLAPGEITDDTQMTLAIARSLAETGTLEETMAVEGPTNARASLSHDGKEAGRAFVEKRPAQFRGY